MIQRSITNLDDDFVQLVIEVALSDIDRFRSSVVPLCQQNTRIDLSSLYSISAEKDAAYAAFMHILSASLNG